MVITKTPYRVSFFGGGTDFPLWFRENGGSVISTAINQFCYVSVRRKPPFFPHKHRFVYSEMEDVNELKDIKHPAIKGVLQWLQWEEGLEIHHDGDLPARSGLGSSSAFTVGLLNAMYQLMGRATTLQQLAKDAIQVEQEVIGEVVGSQDQIAVACGGFNRIDFLPEGGWVVKPVSVSSTRLQQLQDHLLLYFTGFSRFASQIEASKLVNFSSRKQELQRMMQMVTDAERLLIDESRDLHEFGSMLQEAWEYKKSLSTGVTTTAIDDIYNRAIAAGSIGGKILGAGGGGFMLFFVSPENQPAVRKALNGFIEVPFQFEQEGSRVVLG
ncbi:MAG: kinase [Chitinophagaceae bacterium]|nr:kinase [Chitinophagaceae bacterium]